MPTNKQQPVDLGDCEQCGEPIDNTDWTWCTACAEEEMERDAIAYDTEMERRFSIMHEDR